MGNISLVEILVVLVVALLVFGPGRLPEIARGLGKAMHEFRAATDKIQSELQLDPVQPVEVERLDEGTPRPSDSSAPTVAKEQQAERGVDET